MQYLIYTQTNHTPNGPQTGVYISRSDGRLDQYTGNSHVTTLAAEKLLQAAKVEYRVIASAEGTGDERAALAWDGIVGE